MKKKSELQKLIEEVVSSFSSLGEELIYWTAAFLESMNEEFEQFLREFFASMTGGFTPSMKFDLDDITEADVICKK